MRRKLLLGDARALAARINNRPNGDVGAWCWTCQISSDGLLLPSSCFEQHFQMELPLDAPSAPLRGA